MTISAVSLTSSKITWEMCLWVCLQRIILITLISVRRPISVVDDTIPWAGILNYIKPSWTPAHIHCPLFLEWDPMRPISPLLLPPCLFPACCYVFPATMSCTLNCKPKLTLSPSGCFYLGILIEQQKRNQHTSWTLASFHVSCSAKIYSDSFTLPQAWSHLISQDVNEQPHCPVAMESPDLTRCERAALLSCSHGVTRSVKMWTSSLTVLQPWSHCFCFFLATMYHLKL